MKSIVELLIDFAKDISAKTGIKYIEGKENRPSFSVEKMNYVEDCLKSPTGIWFDVKSLCLVIVNGDGNALGVRSVELRISKSRNEKFVDALIKSLR